MIPIVFSTDHNYVMPTGITIASLLLSAGPELYDIYVMTGGDVTEGDKEKLTRQVMVLSPDSRISFVGMDAYYNDAYEVRGVSKATYYRLMIPWLIPEIDKIIYADVDMIFRTPLREIYDIDLNGKYLAGALTSSPESWKRYKRYLDKIGVDYTSYFNAGILVINSRLQRENNVDKEYCRLSAKKFLYQDQDILNIVCKGKAAFFDRRFNLLPSLYDNESGYGRDVVIHYAGDKPWNTFTFAWAEWWDVYNRSIFTEEGFYHSVSARVLNPLQQFKELMRKGKIHIQILRRKIF